MGRSSARLGDGTDQGARGRRTLPVRQRTYTGLPARTSAMLQPSAPTGKATLARICLVLGSCFAIIAVIQALSDLYLAPNPLTAALGLWLVGGVLYVLVKRSERDAGSKA